MKLPTFQRKCQIKLYKIKKDLDRFLYQDLYVLGAGLEPAQPNGHKILSLACLPFHHPSIL